MSTPTKIAFARPVNDMAREVRVIHALFPQECLDQLSPDLTTYHNTGVQTLPPANGDVYKLINGREPSQTDYTRNMGLAAIGRYQQDPRSNPCELIYGAAYTAPHATATYTSSGFQTADYNTSRRALARAKVQASVTANKYRGAAAQAGYVVCAESKDEYIVHSEQYPTTARLDKGGNLLEGSIQTRHLPNIHHSSVKMDACQSPRYPSEPFERMSALDEYGDVRSSADEFVTATSPDVLRLRRHKNPITPSLRKILQNLLTRSILQGWS
ncbi:hypothetical protein M3J09_005303 [Ascochyta lentis]